MQKKFISAPVALVAALALATGPVSAEGVDTEGATTTCVDDASTDELVDEPTDQSAETEIDEMTDAAKDAAAAVADIVEEEANNDDDGCVTGHDRAEESLQAALDRLTEEGAGGNGVASQILAALVNGDSPAGIGAAHGKAMAQAAALARGEREDERDADGHGNSEDAGRSDHAGRPASSVDDDADESTDDDTEASVDDENESVDDETEESADDQDESDAESGDASDRPMDAGNSEGTGRP